MRGLVKSVEKLFEFIQFARSMILIRYALHRLVQNRPEETHVSQDGIGVGSKYICFGAASCFNCSRAVFYDEFFWRGHEHNFDCDFKGHAPNDT